MTVEVRSIPKAFAVRFTDLDRWNVSFFRQVSWLWPAEVIRPIGGVLRRKQVEVDTAIPRVELPIIEKITFGGEVSLTTPEDRIGYKGRLFWASSGDFV